MSYLVYLSMAEQISRIIDDANTSYDRLMENNVLSNNSSSEEQQMLITQLVKKAETAFQELQVQDDIRNT